MFSSLSRGCVSLNPHHLFSCCISLLPDLFPGTVLFLYLNNYFLKIFEVFHFIMVVSVSIFNSRPLKLFSNLCPAITVTRSLWALSHLLDCIMFLSSVKSCSWTGKSQGQGQSPVPQTETIPWAGRGYYLLQQVWVHLTTTTFSQMVYSLL